MKISKKMLWIPAVLIAAIVLGKRAGWLEPTNICATSPNHADASLRTRIYAASAAQVRAAALRSLAAQRTYGRAWKIVGDKNIDGEDEIHAEVFVLAFTDDLTITIREEKNAVHVDVRSQSRVGRGDLGENRRHVWQFLKSLDAELSATKK